MPYVPRSGIGVKVRDGVTGCIFIGEEGVEPGFTVFRSCQRQVDLKNAGLMAWSHLGVQRPSSTWESHRFFSCENLRKRDPRTY